MVLYRTLLVLVGLQRLLEVRHSIKNETWLREHGAEEFGAGHFPWMVLVHGLWLVFCFTASFFVTTSPHMYFYLGLFLLGQALRILAIKSLGKRWTVKILVLPQTPLVRKGIYRYLRHPNYWGVVLEIFSLPMMLGLWKEALFFSLANALVLFFRIREEERALTFFGGHPT